MLLGRDELTILRGSKFYGTWQWINSITGDAEDFSGLTATVKIKNIHEDFADIKNTYEVGTATVEPLDIDSNAFKGRVDISLSKTDTLNFAIPESEEDRYGESDFYSILSITLSTGEVILQAKVRVVESLESEILNFLLDNRGEAIIIAGKLDNILLRNDEFISTRDNLIDIVIPTAIQTYNDNHLAKLDTYNLNHTEKLQIINDLAVLVSQDKILVSQDKDAVNLMKQDIQSNTDNVASMKSAIEAMLDNFDDRFLGLKDANPTLDNDGNELVIGAIYYNNIAKELRFYNGVSWDSPVAAAQTYALQASQYASDALASKNAAKTSEDNAKLSEQNAQLLASQVANNYEPKNVNIQNHISNSSNPHEVTKEQLGLENVDNTADSEKNVATAQNTLKLDGKTLEELKSIFFPRGIISKWYGAIATIPSGWALCDGTNGTPDLRDKFIVGASTDIEGASNTSITGSNTRTGGSKDAIVVSHTHTQAAHAHSQVAHTHGDYGHAHSAWTDGQGNHAHTTQGHVSINKFFYSGGGGTDGIGIPYSAGAWTSESGHHAHNVGIAAGYANLATATPAIHEATPTINNTGSSGANANLPPYFALAYIMKG